MTTATDILRELRGKRKVELPPGEDRTPEQATRDFRRLERQPRIQQPPLSKEQPFQPFQQPSQEFPAVSGRATLPLTFEEAGQLPEQFDPLSEEEQARQTALSRGETHYLFGGAWKIVERAPEPPLTRMPFETQLGRLGKIPPFKQIGEFNKELQGFLETPEGQIATLGVGAAAIFTGLGIPALQQGWRTLTNLALMRQISRTANERNIKISQDEAQVFAIRLKDLAKQKGFKWDLDKSVLKNFFKPFGKQTVPTPAAAKKVEEMVTRAVNRFADVLIPRGTQTGIAFGGKIPPRPVPMPPEVQAEQIARANALLEQVPVSVNKITSIPAGEGEIVIRTDSQGQTLVTAQLVLREGQLTASNIVLAEGKGLAGGRAVKEVIDYLQENNIALPPRNEMSPEALRIVDKLAPAVEAPVSEVPAGVTDTLLQGVRDRMSRNRSARGGPRPFYERELDRLELAGIDTKNFETAFFKYHDLLTATPVASKQARDKAWVEFLDSIKALPKAPVTPQPSPEAPVAIPEGVAPPITPTRPPEVTVPAEPPIEAGKPVMADFVNSPQAVIDMAAKPDVGRYIANLPIIKQLMRTLNPSAVANTPAERALIIRAVLRDEGQQKSAGLIATLNKLGSQDKVFGKTDDAGKLTSGVLKGKPLNDIRTYPNRYKLTDKQKQWIKAAEDIEKAKLAFLTRNGIDVNELTFEEGGRYAGRRVYGKVLEGELLDSAYVGAGPARPGAKIAAEKIRTFKTAEEAVEAGYRYLPEDEALALNVQGAYNRVADKQMSEWLLTQVPWRTTAAPDELIIAAESAKVTLNRSKQLVAALNRAVRGERIPDATINSIRAAYPDQAQRLKDLIPKLQTGKPTAREVQQLTKEARAYVSANTKEWRALANQRARAREQALRPRYGESSVPAPAFAGKFLTGSDAKDTANVLRQGFDPSFSNALGQVNKANAVARYFMLAGDMSPMTIQLLYLAGENPATYVKAFGGFVQSLFDTKFHSKYLAENKHVIDNHPNLILTKSGATEFTEAMARGGWLSTKHTLIPKQEKFLKTMGLLTPRVVGRAAATVLEPFQRGFEIALDTAGIEMAKSLEHLATTPAETAELDQFINEFRGVTSSARLGVSPLERQVETSAILAPRYNRAIAGLLYDTVFNWGTLRGHRARIGLAKGIAAVSAMAVAISYARGEDKDEILEHFNPNSSKFFTWEINGQQVGPGTKIRSVIKLFAQSAKDPEALLEFGMENPALRFIRGNFSPAVGSAVDLITGKNYIGDPTRDSWQNFSEEIIASNMLPIWVQSALLEGGDIGQKAVRGAVEFIGGRAYPSTEWDKLKELREKYASESGLKMLTGAPVKKWEDLNSAQIRELLRDNPELKQTDDDATAHWATAGSDLEKWFYNAKINVRGKRDSALEKSAVALSEQKISKRDYDNERKYTRAYYSGSMAILFDAKEELDPKSVKQIEEWLLENQKLEDRIMNQYKEFYSELIDKSELPRDWAAIDASLDAFLKQAQPTYRQYVLDHKDDWMKDLPPNARQIEEWRLRGIEDETWWDGYWDKVESPSSVAPQGEASKLLDELRNK